MSEEELKVSLEDFARKYADPLGYPEYAILPPRPLCKCLSQNPRKKSSGSPCFFRPMPLTRRVVRSSRKKMKIQARPTEEMKKKYTPLPTKSNPNPQPDCGTVYVDFCELSSGIGARQVREFNQVISENNLHTGIFITQVPLSPTALRMVHSNPGCIGETFQEQDLLVNITRHELVPKHVLLSPEEKAKLLERYRLKESQLPRMQVSDPVARYLGLRRGQVVKIIRKSETAGRYASYRWVI